MFLHKILQNLHAHVRVVDLKKYTILFLTFPRYKQIRVLFLQNVIKKNKLEVGLKTLLTDFTLWPMPMISLPSFFILLTNSIGNMPLSKALLNCFAAASRAPPKRSPFNSKINHLLGNRMFL